MEGMALLVLGIPVVLGAATAAAIAPEGKRREAAAVGLVLGGIAQFVALKAGVGNWCSSMGRFNIPCTIGAVPAATGIAVGLMKRRES